jgi:hypothetical protein
VVLVLDGARPDYFQLAPMPNLHWLQQHGTTYSSAFVGQLIANTPPGHATIGTGMLPKHHGIPEFVWKDPGTGQMTTPTDVSQVQRGSLERIMAAHHVPSIAASVKAADPHARVLAASGNKCYAADALGTASADYILCALIYHRRWVAQAMGSHRPPPGAINNSAFDMPIPPASTGLAATVEQWRLGTEEDWVVRYALWAFKRVHYPRVMLLNLPETDVSMHFAGPDRHYAAILMRHIDDGIGRIMRAYRHAGLLKRTVFVVTADHGMTVIRGRFSYGQIDQAVDNAGATKVALVADTAIALDITPASRAQAVARNIAALDGGGLVDATYYKVQTGSGWVYRQAYARPYLSAPVRRAYQLLANTVAAPAGPDVLGVYAPRVATGDHPVGRYHWLASHLGPQWEDQHIPFIIAGPGVRHGVTSTYPARLVDIAPTVERLLRARHTVTDGVVLADALRYPTKSERAVQAARGKRLGPVVQALRRRMQEK